MRPDDLLKRLEDRPFRPFRIHPSDGTSIKYAMRILRFIAVVLLALTSGQKLRAGQTTAPLNEQPTPAEVVSQVLLAFDRLNALAISVHAQIDQRTAPLVSVSPGGNADIQIQVLMGRRNKFRLEASQDDQCLVIMVGDGKTIVEWDVPRNRWTRYPQPSNSSAAPRLLGEGRVSDSPVASLIGPYAQCWLEANGPYHARLYDLLDEIEFCVTSNQTVGGRPCYILGGVQKTSEKGMKFVSEGTLAFDRTTGLPVYEESRTNLSVLLIPAIRIKRRFDYERVQANPVISGDAFHIEVPPDCQFVEPSQLLPTSDSELVGELVPSARFDTLDGRSVDLAEYCGERAVVLVFWATWCAPCKSELGDLQALASEQEFGANMQIVAVSTDRSRDAVRSFLQRRELPFITLHDARGDAGGLFGVQGIPTTFVIDREGTVLRSWTGWDSGLSLDAIRDSLRQTISGDL